MAKRPRPGKCVHCLRDPIARNWDHVFPRSWYPDATPRDQYKWQVPSCIPCNEKLGKLEEEFLRLVGPCLDRDAPASAGVTQKALRSMSPSAAKSDKECKIRESLRRRVIDSALYGDEIPNSSVIPGMGERWGRSREQQIAIPIPADCFELLTEKIVRGIFYVVDRKFIEPPFTVEFVALDPSNGKSIRDLIDRFGATYAREPGIVVRRAVASDDGISSLSEIEFWRHFKTYAFVTHSDS